MSWSIGYDSRWHRWIGYGVPAYCDHPECSKEIDRGLAYVCGAEPYGGDDGCGLFFCPDHQVGEKQKCARCDEYYLEPFPAKPDHPQWIQHVLHDSSWRRWRGENPGEVARLEAGLNKTQGLEQKGPEIASGEKALNDLLAQPRMWIGNQEIEIVGNVVIEPPLWEDDR